MLIKHFRMRTNKCHINTKLYNCKVIFFKLTMHILLKFMDHTSFC